MCDCSGTCSCVVEYPQGLKGDTRIGIYGGFSSEWAFSSSTSSGTSTTELRFNNATLASVTSIYINETNINSTDMAAFLASFSNAGSFGRITIFKEDNANIFWMGTITAVTDSGSEYALTVTHIQSNGTFTAADDVVASFTPKGDIGNVGYNNVVFVDAAYGSNTTGAVDNYLKPYQTITAAKTAASSGDLIYVRPGTYDDTNILKDGVNYYFDKGAILAAGSAIGDSAGAVTCNIYGYLDIVTTETKPINILNGSTVRVNMGTITVSGTTTNEAIFCQPASGDATLHVTCQSITAPLYGINARGNTIFVGNVKEFIQADQPVFIRSAFSRSFKLTCPELRSNAVPNFATAIIEIQTDTAAAAMIEFNCNINNDITTVNNSIASIICRGGIVKFNGNIYSRGRLSLIVGISTNGGSFTMNGNITQDTNTNPPVYVGSGGDIPVLINGNIKTSTGTSCVTCGTGGTLGGILDVDDNSFEFTGVMKNTFGTATSCLAAGGTNNVYNIRNAILVSAAGNCISGTAAVNVMGVYSDVAVGGSITQNIENVVVDTDVASIV